MKLNNTTNLLFFRIVQIATVAVFLGRAWQHLWWDAPYRSWLWDEYWMRPFVASVLGMDWKAYIHSPIIEDYIQLGVKVVGGYYLISAIVALLLKKIPKLGSIVLMIGAFSLAFLAFLYCKERFFSIGQFWEYTLQFGSPILLVYLFWRPQVNTQLLLIIKIAIALTFSAHGLYAIGYYPRPVLFMEMTMNILRVGEEQAITFLNIAGILDFVMSIGIFLPWRWAKYSLGYAVFWGFSTAIARIWANFSWDWWDDTLVQWLHETVMRFPHFLIPLAVWLYYYQKTKAAPTLAV